MRLPEEQILTQYTVSDFLLSRSCNSRAPEKAGCLKHGVDCPIVLQKSFSVHSGKGNCSGSQSSSGLIATRPHLRHLNRTLFFLLWHREARKGLVVPHQSAFVVCPCTLHIPSALRETAPQFAQINALVSFGRVMYLPDCIIDLSPYQPNGSVSGTRTLDYEVVPERLTSVRLIMSSCTPLPRSMK